METLYIHCAHYEPLMSLWLRTTYLLLEASCVKDTAQRGEKDDASL